MTCKECASCSSTCGCNMMDIRGIGHGKKALSELKPGESGLIDKVNGNGALRKRILDMGLTKGSPVTVVKKAPLGDPMELKIRGYSLSIRKKEAELIVLT